jgi:hypothetical protein
MFMPACLSGYSHGRTATTVFTICIYDVKYLNGLAASGNGYIYASLLGSGSLFESPRGESWQESNKGASCCGRRVNSVVTTNK